MFILKKNSKLKTFTTSFVYQKDFSEINFELDYCARDADESTGEIYH